MRDDSDIHVANPGERKELAKVTNIADCEGRDVDVRHRQSPSTVTIGPLALVPRLVLAIHGSHVVSAGRYHRLRFESVSAIRACVGLCKPFLDAIGPKHMLAARETQGFLDQALRVLDPILIVTNNASYIR